MSHYYLIDQTRTIFITWGLCLSMKLLMKVLCSSEIIMRAHLSGLTLRAFKVKSCIKSSLSSEATGISPSRMWTIVTLGSFQVSLSCSTEVLNLFVTRQTLFLRDSKKLYACKYLTYTPMLSFPFSIGNHEVLLLQLHRKGAWLQTETLNEGKNFVRFFFENANSPL